MKKNKFILPAALMLSLMTMNSCSIFRLNDAGKETKGEQGWVETGKEDTKKVVDNSKKEAETAIAKVDEKLKEIADVQSHGALSGDWAIETVLGKPAVGETAPFLKFVPAESHVYGNNGCNTLTGEYKSSYTDKTITFGDIATTMMLCATTGITDIEIAQAMQRTRTYSVDYANHDNQLTFYDADGKTVMTLMHRDFHFLDGTWAVESIDGEKVTVEGMKLALDVDEKKMHGNTGCDIINGVLDTDMDTANSISFSGIAMTRMACPDSGWETRMVVALEEAITAKKINDDTIEFIGSNGKQVMLLKKTSPIED